MASAHDRHLNLAAFRYPCTPAGCHYGNLPRNFFTGPDFKNFDISIIKNTPLSERVTIQFRADFFNFTNRANFASPPLPAFLASADFQGISGPGTGLGGR